MPETYGYVCTSRPRVSELPGSDPETQRQQLLAADVALSHIYQDVGVSGTSGTQQPAGLALSGLPAGLEVWPETPILPKSALSKRRLSMK